MKRVTQDPRKTPHLSEIPAVMTHKFPNFSHVKQLLTNPSGTFLDLIGQSSPPAEARADIMAVIKFAKFVMVLVVCGLVQGLG
jgi:hypothetical protein